MSVEEVGNLDADHQDRLLLREATLRREARKADLTHAALLELHRRQTTHATPLDQGVEGLETASHFIAPRR